jgi:hypothetical protein
MALPFALWATTGLLFHLKPGWDRAYERLSIESQEPTLDAAVLIDVMSILGNGAPATRVELFGSVLGPLYRISRAGGTSLVDGQNGSLISPLSRAEGLRLVDNAVARSPHRDAYGERIAVKFESKQLRVRFKGGRTVSLNRNSGELAQKGSDTDVIDWLYRIHYMQWTGQVWADRILSTTSIVGVWLVTMLGVVLLARSRP